MMDDRRKMSAVTPNIALQGSRNSGAALALAAP